MIRFSLCTCFYFIFSSAIGCSCFFLRPITVETLLYDGLVFTGKVISVETTNGGVPNLGSNVATFAVDRWFSPHEVTDTVVVKSSGSCGLAFSYGERWLIYAGEINTMFYTTVCTPSQKISGSKDKQFLQKLKHLNTLLLKSGPVKEYSEWTNGSYSISGNLRNGKPFGQWLRLRGQDTIAIFNFNSFGERQGYQMEKNEDYDKLFESYYERTDSSVLVYSKTKQLMKSYKLKGHIRNGNYEEYWNGELNMRAHYIAGCLEGEWISWHEDGAIAQGKIKTMKRFLHNKLESSTRFDEEGNRIPD